MSYAVDWVVSKNHATLPNCDGCGRFTSNPTEVSWCQDGGDYHACYGLLLCPRCIEKRTTDDNRD